MPMRREFGQKQGSELLRKKPPAPSVKVRKNVRIVVIKRRRRLKG
jgi:hypothetical protein